MISSTDLISKFDFSVRMYWGITAYKDTGYRIRNTYRKVINEKVNILNRLLVGGGSEATSVKNDTKNILIAYCLCP